MVFPVVMYGCESWTVKKAEHRRINAFELWCWRRLLRVPWTARRSNQSILKETSPGFSLIGLILKLKPQYFVTWCEELTHLKRSWCWERLRAGGEGDDTGWDGWMASPIQWTQVWVNSGSWWWTERPSVLRFMGLQRVGHDWATKLKLMAWIWLWIWFFIQSPSLDCDPCEASHNIIFISRSPGPNMKWLTEWMSKIPQIKNLLSGWKHGLEVFTNRLNLLGKERKEEI